MKLQVRIIKAPNGLSDRIEIRPFCILLLDVNFYHDPNDVLELINRARAGEKISGSTNAEGLDMDTKEAIFSELLDELPPDKTRISLEELERIILLWKKHKETGGDIYTYVEVSDDTDVNSSISTRSGWPPWPDPFPANA